MKKDLTDLQAKYLYITDTLQNQHELFVGVRGDIVEAVLRYDYAPTKRAANEMITRLLNLGYLKKVARGMYRVTRRGYDVLGEVIAEKEAMG